MDNNSGPNWDDIYSLEEFQATINADTAAHSTAGNGVLAGVKSTAETSVLPTIHSFMGAGMASNQSSPHPPTVHNVPIAQGIHNVPLGIHTVTDGIHNVPIVQGTHNAPMMPRAPQVGPVPQGIHNVPMASNTPNMPITQPVHNVPMSHNAPVGRNSPSRITPIGHNAPISQVHDVPISTGSSQPEELMDFVITRNDIDEPGADVNQPTIEAPGLGQGTFFMPFPEVPAVSEPSVPVLQPTPHPPPVSVAPPPVSVAPPPVSVAPPPVSVAPPPVSVAPPPVSVAPPPINVAPPPVSVAPPPVRIAPIRTYCCPMCTEDFVSAAALENHALSHREMSRASALPENNTALQTSTSDSTEDDSKQCTNTEDRKMVDNINSETRHQNQNEEFGEVILDAKTDTNLGTSSEESASTDTEADANAGAKGSEGDDTEVDTAKCTVVGVVQTVRDTGQVLMSTTEKDTVMSTTEKDTLLSKEPTSTETEDGHIAEDTLEKKPENQNSTGVVAECDTTSQNGTEDTTQSIEKISTNVQSDSGQEEPNRETHVVSNEIGAEGIVKAVSKDSAPACNGNTEVMGSHSSTSSDPSNSNQENMEVNSTVYDETSPENTQSPAAKPNEANCGFSCKVCGALREDIVDLKAHMDEEHSDPKPYTCVLCDSSFDELQVLRNHLSEDHDATLCFGCGEEMVKVDLQAHLLICNFPMLPDLPGNFKQILQEKLKLGKKDQDLNEKPPVQRPKGIQFDTSQIYSQKKPSRLRGQFLKSLSTRKKHDVNQCLVCKKQFNLNETLVKHMKCYHADEDVDCTVYSCEACGKAFQSRQNLLLHRSLAHKTTKRHQCSVCDKRFRKYWQLQNHAKSHKTDHLICNICGESFQSPTILQTHLVSHYTQGRFSCGVCGLQFENQDRLETHLRSHNPVAVRENTIAAGRLNEPTITSLPIAHQDIKSEPIDYGYGDMEVGNATFSAQESLQPNLNLQIGEAFSLMEPSAPPKFSGYRIVKPVGSVQIGYPNTTSPRFTCDVCIEEYPTEYDLLLHKTKYHKEAFADSFDCSICDRVFATKAQLFGHLAKHRESNTCRDCGDSYKYYGAHLKFCPGKKTKKRALNIALSKENPKRARIRKDTEPDEEKLRQVEAKVIQRLHDSAVAYGNMLCCPSCSKSFEPDSLKDHLKAHIDEKQMHCPSCAKNYRFSEAFDKHLDQCARQAKYSCDHCGQTFYLKCLWHVHRLDHYRSKATYIKLPPFECCQNTYPHIAGFFLHQRQSHGKNVLRVQCRLCQAHFVGLDAYLRHVEENPSDEQFVCPCCLKCFHVQDSVEKHIQQSHPNDAEQCSVCEKSVLARDLPKHRKDEHGPVFWVDKDIFSLPSSASSSVPRSRSGKPRKTLLYQCGLCQKQFRSYYYIREHALTEHKQHIEEDILRQRNELGVGEDDVTREDILRHMAKRKMLVVADPVDPNTCLNCCQTFRSEQSFKQHKETGCEGNSQANGSENPVESLTKDDGFVADGLLLGGYKSVTVGEPTKYWCEKCEVYCRSVHYFTKHLVIHEKNIDVLQYKDIIERRRYIEQMVGEFAPIKPKEWKGSKPKRKKGIHIGYRHKASTWLAHYGRTKRSAKTGKFKKSFSANVEKFDSNEDNATKNINEQVIKTEKLPKKKESDEARAKPIERPVRTSVLQKSVQEEPAEIPAESPVCAGYKSMTVATPTKSWCNICKVYFRNSYYLTKHLIIHEKNIHIDTETEVTERRQNIERLVSELTPSRRKDLPPVGIKLNKRVPKVDDSGQDGKDPGDNGKCSVEDGNDPVDDATSSQEEQPTERLHNESKIEEDSLALSSADGSAAESSMVRAGFKYMTVEEETKFWCDSCVLFYRNGYYYEKHMIIHERNIDVDTSTSVAERRQTIESLVAKLAPMKRKENPEAWKQKIRDKKKKHRTEDTKLWIKKQKYRNQGRFQKSEKKDEESASQKKDPTPARSTRLSSDRSEIQESANQTDASSSRSETDSSISGSDAMTVEHVTKFWCDRCDVYFRNEHCFAKHHIIHEHDINVANIRNSEERRRSIEHLVAELSQKGKDSIKIIPASGDDEMTEARDESNDEVAGGKNEEQLNKDQIDLPHLAQITRQDQIFTEKTKPLALLQSHDQLETEQSKETTSFRKKDYSSYKPMTSEQRTKFWCTTCHVYFKNDYFNKKHMIIHEHNVDFGHIEDVAERRSQIEQCIRKLTMKPKVATPKLKSPKSLPVKHITKFGCQTCGEYYRNYYFLKVHIKENHASSDKLPMVTSDQKDSHRKDRDNETPGTSYVEDSEEAEDDSLALDSSKHAEDSDEIEDDILESFEMESGNSTPEPCVVENSDNI